MQLLSTQFYTLPLLLASDCHLGYKEKDPIRGHDSLVTFEEVFEIAKEHQVIINNLIFTCYKVMHLITMTLHNI